MWEEERTRELASKMKNEGWLLGCNLADTACFRTLRSSVLSGSEIWTDSLKVPRKSEVWSRRKRDSRLHVKNVQQHQWWDMHSCRKRVSICFQLSLSWVTSVRVSWGRGWVSEGKRRAEAIGERKGTSVVRQFGFCIWLKSRVQL